MAKTILCFLLLGLLQALPAKAVEGTLRLDIFPAAPELSATAAFFGPSGGGMLYAEETGSLLLVVKNSGKGDAFGVVATILPANDVSGLSFDRSIAIGTVPAQGSVSRKIELKAGEETASQHVALTLHVFEARGFDAASVGLSFLTKLQKEPAEEADKHLAGVDVNIPEGRKAGKYDIAVVIGNHSYTDADVPAVDYADRGARIMKAYLVRTFGYDPENIIYVENATLSQFNRIFGTDRDYKGKLYNWIRKDESSVFIYYAGHGAPDLDSTEAYLVPADASPAHIRATGYSLQTFYDNLGKIPAKGVTVVLDACFSGASEGGMLFSGISPAMLRVQKEYREPANAVLFTSAAVDQVSTWYPEKRHSLFTYYFLKGVQGAADADRNGRITVGEMKHYLKEHVPYKARRLSGRAQQPVVIGREDEVLVVIQ